MRTVLLGVVALFALAPATASATTSFTGQTAQNKPVELEFADDGLIRFVDVGWKTSACSKTGRKLSDTTSLRAPFASSTVDAFAFDRTLGRRKAGGVRIAIAMKFSGLRTATGWGGQLSLKAVVRKNGVVTDRCKLGRTTWTAALEPE